MLSYVHGHSHSDIGYFMTSPVHFRSLRSQETAGTCPVLQDRENKEVKRMSEAFLTCLCSRHAGCGELSLIKRIYAHSVVVSCDGRVVKALDLKSNGVSPRRFEPCSQRFFFLPPKFFLSVRMTASPYVPTTPST